MRSKLKPLKAVIAASMTFLAASLQAATTYYISSSGGNDLNSGTSTSAPWQTFNNINSITLQPGDQVLLKANDSWNQELNLTGNGNSTASVTLGTYGGAGSALISRSSVQYDKCVVINNPSYWNIYGLDLRNAKIGIYLRYEDTSYNTDVTISWCYFQDIADGTYVPANHNYELAWSCGIFLGGKVNPAYEYVPILDNLKIQYCGFQDCDVGFGTNFYFPAVYKSRIRNIQIEDCWSVGALGGGFFLNFVDGGHVKRFRSLYSGGYVSVGTAGGFAQSCKNVLIDDCEFAYTDRDPAVPDGVGFDFEGDNENMTFSNNVVHHNDGAGMLIMSTVADNSNLIIKDNTFYNNGINPSNSDNDYEIKCHDNDNTGSFDNNGFYRNGTNAVYSTKLDNFTKTNTRDLNFSTLVNRPVTWEWDTTMDLEGWNGFNQWSSNTVSNDVLWGLTTGTDPYAYSNATFANSHEIPKVKVRMKQSAGNWGQLFYITETDTTWNGAKSLFFPITPDNQMREYTIDLRDTDVKGCVTQVRLDPTLANNSAMAIDYVRFAAP